MIIFGCARGSGDLLMNSVGDAPARYVSKEVKIWNKKARAKLADYEKALKGILLVYGASGKEYKREVFNILRGYKKSNKENIMASKIKIKCIKKMPQGEEKMNEFRRVRKEYRDVNKNDFKALQDKGNILIERAIKCCEMLNKEIQKERGDERFKLMEQAWIQKVQMRKAPNTRLNARMFANLITPLR